MPLVFTPFASYNNGVTITITDFGTGSGSDNFWLYLDFGLPKQQRITGLTSWILNTPRTIPWINFPSGLNGRTGGETIAVKLINTSNDDENNLNTVLYSQAITATADYSTGITVTITDFGSGNDTNTFSLLLDEGLATAQSETGLTGWTLDTPRTIAWAYFTPPGQNGRLIEDTITIKLTNTTADPDTNSNIVSTILTGTGGPPTITATADYTTGVTVTITNFGKGNGSNTFSLLLDEGLAKEQSETGLITWTLNQPRTIAWADFSPSGQYGRAGGETITAQLTNTTPNPDTRSNLVIMTLTGSGGIPCFVASSKLLTPTGYFAAKDIKTGDLLMTADGRQVPVKTYYFTVENADKDSAPFLISKNSISLGCPNADLRLSPWHAFQMKKGLWMKPMSALELGMPVQQYDLGKSVTYYHFEAPDYFKDNFVCEGTVVESFGVLQTKDMKGRVYTYNTNLKGYTRAAGMSVTKSIMM
jgi:hypothetical protein